MVQLLSSHEGAASVNRYHAIRRTVANRANESAAAGRVVSHKGEMTMGKKSDWERTAKKLAKIYGNPAAPPQPNPEYTPQTDAERAETEKRYQKWNENRYGKDNKNEQ